MTVGPAPVIIVSLPARSARDAREELARAAEAGADLAEIRFDRWEPPERGLAATLFPSPVPLLATLRSMAEGGEGPNDPLERSRILTELARLPFRWIDLEEARDRPEQLPRPPETLGRILSTHRTTSVSAAEWSALLRRPPAAGTVRKVVVPATVGSLLLELLPHLPPPGEGSVIALTTGPSGPLLRAWSRRLGFPMVFASLPEASAPGTGEAPVEPSQIPVDRLRPFLAAPEGAPLFGLAGHPVSHSRSPSLHGRWMQRTGRAGLYVALDFASEEEFVEALAPLAERGLRGLNVTHPYKAAALECSTEVGPGAGACGVANCLTFRNGTVEAENTDLAAILRRMEELRRSGRWDGKSVSVVGTGGAARATLAAARELGAEPTVYGRQAVRTSEVAREFGARAGSSDSARPDRLVVHATDVGRPGTGPLEVPIGRLVAQGTVVLDWVYDPEVPTVRETVETAGGSYEGGTRLLVYQAAATFGLWWGEEPEPEELARTLEEEGCTA
jgi:shikimate dehydrogenase